VRRRHRRPGSRERLVEFSWWGHSAHTVPGEVRPCASSRDRSSARRSSRR
jgi:hypothetical protein